MEQVYVWIKYCFVFCRKWWRPCKDTAGQRKRGIWRLRYSYLKWLYVPHMPPALWGDRSPFLGLPPPRIYFLRHRPAHGVIHLTLVKANTPQSMQKCRCGFCVQAGRFWWKAGIAALNMRGKKMQRGAWCQFFVPGEEHWKVIQVCTHSSIQSLTQLFTQSMCISLITGWIGSSTLIS